MDDSALREHITELKAALQDCMRYVDCDNLTMQTKHRSWEAALNGERFNPANCEVTSNA